MAQWLTWVAVIAASAILNLFPEGFSGADVGEDRLVPRGHLVAVWLGGAPVPANAGVDLWLHVVDGVDDIHPEAERVKV